MYEPVIRIGNHKNHSRIKSHFVVLLLVAILFRLIDFYVPWRSRDAGSFFEGQKYIGG